MKYYFGIETATGFWEIWKDISPGLIQLVTTSYSTTIKGNLDNSDLFDDAYGWVCKKMEKEFVDLL